VAVTIFDKDSSITCTGNLTVTSSNTALVPSDATGISIAGAAQSCTLGFTPTLNQSGSTTITMSLPYSPTAVTETFTLNVTAANDAPTLAAISAQSTNEDTALNGIELTVADVDSTLVCGTALSVTTSTNSTLLPTSAVTFSTGGSAGKCNMNIAPAANKNGTSDITVRLSDGTLHADRTFTLTVNAVNDEPTISTISSQVATEDTSKTVSFTINDVDGDLTCTSTHLLALSTDSSKVNTSGSGVTFSGTYPNCVATVNPVSNAFGTTFMTFLVQDGSDQNALSSSRTFQLSITAVNDAPTITSPGNQTTNEDTTKTINITMYDVDNTLTCPTPSASMTIASQDTTLLPSGNIAQSLSGSSGGHVTCSVSLTPATNLSGTVALNISATDGQYTDTKSFNLTIDAVNDAPTISAISAQSTPEDQAKSISFTIADVDGALTCDTNRLSYTSGNSARVATTGAVTWSGTSGSCTANVTPVANATGTVSMSFTVNDGANGGSGSLSATSTFDLTLDPANDAPTITLGNLPSVSEDQASAPVVPFTLADIDSNLSCNSTYLSYQSLDTNKIAASNAVSFGGTWPNCTATVTLLANANGSSSFKINVNDNANGGTGGAMSAEATVNLNVTAVNDAPTGTVVCDTLGSGNVFRTAAAAGGAWSLASCSGASDVDGDQLTYQLDLIETGAQSSASYPCPATIASSAGGTAISGNFPSGAGVYGSCRYRLKACDGSSQCTAQSTNSVIISSFQLTVGTPTTPTLSSACVVESSGSITASQNLTSVTWSGHTSAPGASASTGTISSYPGTATFNTDITSQLLTMTFLPSTPTKSTQLAAANSTLVITQGALVGASANPPSAQITSSTSSSSNYTITRVLESLAVRQGGTSGAASTALEMHSDGQQPEYATTAGCRTCTTNPVVSISAGDSHTCMIESSGTTKCWGNANDGRLGIGSAPSNALIPAAISTTNISSFSHTQIAAGKEFTCLLGSTSNGVTCWGRNNLGQLGRGGSSTTSVFSPSATVVQGLTNPVAISASKTGDHACAVNSSGNAYCWGSNSNGQLGRNNQADSTSAVEVRVTSGGTALPSVRSIATGGSHSCATLSYNSSYTAGIYCWGSNANGQLGDGSTTQSSIATAVATTNQGAATSSVWFTQVVAGTSHTCALRNDGAVFCWGLNSSGQLGDNSTTSRSVPTAVNGLGASSGVVSLSAGGNHTCALKSDHSVLCWGANDLGQLGDGTTTQRNSPITAISSADSSAVALSVGGSHTCVVNMDGTAKCWGHGDYGKLGNNLNSTTEGSANDCEASSESTIYCSKSPALVNWSSGITSNSTLRPKTCHRYTIP
jgi:alpha-tubulin suppressor-like RCC1 family protein